MRNRIFVVVLAVVAWNASVIAKDPDSFGAAKVLWDQAKNRTDYSTYQNEFIQFNNAMKLDERGGCYAVGSGPVELVLIITHRDTGEFAIIEKVFSSTDSARAQCFKRSYLGVQTKVPPYLPFYMQMSMG